MNTAIIVFAIIVAVLLLVGGIVAAVRKYEQARTEKLVELAHQMGLDFHPKGDPAVMEAIGHMRLFNQGHGRLTKNMIFGETDEVDLAVFGYRFMTGGGQNQQTHQQTVICFHSPSLELPSFELRPENFFHRIGQALGYQDIDFDTHPQFSKQFLLRGADEAAIRELFTPERLAFLESRPGISVEAAGDRLIYYRASVRVKPEEVKAFMEDGFEIFAQFAEV